MQAQDRLQRLQQAEWILDKAIPQWVVEPSNYSKPHQDAILLALSAARQLLKPVLEDAQHEITHTEEQA